jgi:uncharacterized protein YbcC (UPF0753/DUF2309 family)
MQNEAPFSGRKNNYGEEKNLQNLVHEILHDIAHFLPSQAPLKDFIHHNSLHAFQHLPFHDALESAVRFFGYKCYMTIDEYRQLYAFRQINMAVFDDVLYRCVGAQDYETWTKKLLYEPIEDRPESVTGSYRKVIQNQLHVNLEKHVHPLLFRIAGAFLDQGVAVMKFPVNNEMGLLQNIFELEQTSVVSFFRSGEVKRMLKNPISLEDLVLKMCGCEEMIRPYLFDQQFAHPGWSGMISVLEHNPGHLYESRKVSLADFVYLELLLELDVLNMKFGEGKWKPVYLPDYAVYNKPEGLMKHRMERFKVLALWQEIYELSYYDEVISGIRLFQNEATATDAAADVQFQAVFCIDDRECSFRRHIDRVEPRAQTFATAGFFNVPFYYRAAGAQHLSKSCPAPQNPSFIICEEESVRSKIKAKHLSGTTHGALGGLFATNTAGFTAGIKLVKNLFSPVESEVSVSSFRHMMPDSTLTILHQGKFEGERQIGFTYQQMAACIEGLLKGIGLNKGFAPLVYLVGHGASSINNTYYAGYDCGACSGRPGSVNARVAASMANTIEVREILRDRAVNIPDTTWFVGGLHDTTRDDIRFYDENLIPDNLKGLHATNKMKLQTALRFNAAERSRRFAGVSQKESLAFKHKKMEQRAFSLFEPRPEWNHATNTLCLIGFKDISKHIFLDRRAFLNSYDYKIDTDGNILLGILNAVAPVCGGINLEYYFSRVDNNRLGGGTKLPHNVAGLLGVVNGMDGDLRTGLPAQMINIHEPMRLLVIIQSPVSIVDDVLRRNESTFEWFKNGWIHLCVFDPVSGQIKIFRQNEFVDYLPDTAIEITEKEILYNNLVPENTGPLPVLRLK